MRPLTHDFISEGDNPMTYGRHPPEGVLPSPARAQRLYERKAFSERQLQAAEVDLKAAKAAYDAAVKRLEALTSSIF